MEGPWVSFCMSTYKRPDFLWGQLNLLLRQSDPNFEVIISDNDPEGSGFDIVKRLNDSRIKYYKNDFNLGMTKSFNRSIERATTPYIVMVTDDDPVEPEMLQHFHNIVNKYPGYPIYCGCTRPGKSPNGIEFFNSEKFVYQLLHPRLTSSFLWSSCVIERKTLLAVGGMPDFGSPHLADHAMLVLCGKNGGGVMLNRMYSYLNKHDNNFSKSNLNLYYIACMAFVKLITNEFSENYYISNKSNALNAHLKKWFIANIFILKKYFIITNPNSRKIREINQLAKDLLSIPLIKRFRGAYIRKSIIFFIKRPLWKLGIIS